MLMDFLPLANLKFPFSLPLFQVIESVDSPMSYDSQITSGSSERRDRNNRRTSISFNINTSVWVG